MRARVYTCAFIVSGGIAKLKDHKTDPLWYRGPEEGWVVKLTEQLSGEKIVPNPT
jgi:hypothetical protein